LIHPPDGGVEQAHRRSWPRHRHTRVTHKTIVYSQASARNRAPGSVKLTIDPNAPAQHRLKALKSLKLTILVRFAPTVGGSSSETVQLTVTRRR
jgi:hypothetical protein